MRFADKVAIVTGAGSGFGEAIATRFAREGARVLVADVHEENGRRVTSAIEKEGGAARFARTDVSRASDVKAMIDAAVSDFGGLDILVNNAGFSHRMTAMWDLSEDDYDRVFATNVKGVFLGCKYAVPAMKQRGGGVIVNTASVSAHRGATFVEQAAHGAAKGGVLALTRHLAASGARHGIRANSISPGLIVTPQIEPFLDEPGHPVHEMRRAHPLGRLGTAEDVARVALFLATDDAGYLNAVDIVVDGGQSLIS